LIRPVDTSLLDAVAKASPNGAGQNDAVAPTGKNAFAAHLKREAVKTTETKPEDATTRVAERATPPEGEKWRPVKGRDDYAEIVVGDRKGQFVNLNRGARRGEAFTIEERDGKTVHVYKKDDAELVIPVATDKGARAAGTRASDREPPKNETWGPVKGAQSYADILSGPRNGWFVNLQQGSVREGEVFHIVKRDGKEFHVYGKDADKVWVEVGASKKKADAAASTGTGATTATPDATTATPDPAAARTTAGVTSAAASAS
jgi:hypothetical protein